MNNKLIASILAAALCLGSTAAPFGNASKISFAISPDAPKQSISVSEGTSVSLGDVNGDGSVDSSDASLILTEYALSLTGGECTFTDNQNIAGDLDKNDSIDSSDASLILTYYAYVSTGGKLSVEEFLEKGSDIPPVTTTATKATTTTVKTTTVTTVKSTEKLTTPATTTKATAAATTTKATAAATTTKATAAATTTKATAAATTTKATAAPTTAKATTAATTTKATAAPTTAKATTAATTTKAPVTTTVTTKVRVSDIRITRTEASVNVGEGTLSAYVTMFPANAENKSEIWTSSDPSIATVDDEGWVVGVKEGECIITVTSADNPDVSAQIKITVINTKSVKDIRISRSEMTIEKGFGELSARVTMLPDTAVNKSEKWTSSNPAIATVDSEGWVIGVSAGTAIITVQSVDNPAVFANILVTVTDSSSVQTTTQISPETTTTTTTTITTTSITTTTEATTTAPPASSEIKPETILISESELTLAVGGQKTVTAAVLPENTTNKKINWTSNNDLIAVVDSSGKISAVSEGKCIITASCAGDPTIKANIIVTVKNTGEVTEIVLSKYEMTLNVGGTDISFVTMYPSSASNQEEIWTSSDESVATVDKYGWVKGVGLGECTVTVFSEDSPSVKAEIKVKVVSGPIEPPTHDFSSIVPGKSTDTEIAFQTPFPANAKGRFVIDYIITDANGKQTTISTPTIVLPAMTATITMLTAETNEFTAEAYLTNLATSKSAKIGSYSFSLYPRDARTETEDINYAFSVLGALS